MSRRIVTIPDDWMTEVHRRAERAGFKRHQWGQYLLTMAIPASAQRKLSPLPKVGKPKAKRRAKKGLSQLALVIAWSIASLLTSTLAAQSWIDEALNQPTRRAAADVQRDVTLTVDYEAYRVPPGFDKQFVTDAQVQSGLYAKKRIRIPHTGRIIRVYQGLTGGTLVEMRIAWRDKWTGITLDRSMLDSQSQRIVDQWQQANPATAARP